MLPDYDYYEILEVASDASLDEIRKAYKKQAVKWHPDKNLDNRELAEEHFKKINTAHEELINAEKRAKYDRDRARQRMEAERPERKAEEKHQAEDFEYQYPGTMSMDAAEKQYQELVLKALLVVALAGAVVLARDEDRQRKGKELANAAYAENWTRVDELIAQGASLDEFSTVEEDDYSALSYVVIYNKLDLARNFLERGAQVNLKGAQGTALHAAVGMKNMPMCALLIREYKAEVHHQNASGSTPLHIAIKHRVSQEIQNLILRNGTTNTTFFTAIRSIDIQDNEGNTPLHLAIIHEQWDTVKSLLSARAKINLRNKAGDTPSILFQGKVMRNALPDESIYTTFRELEKQQESNSSSCLIM